MMRAVVIFCLLGVLVAGCSAPFSSTSGAQGAIPFERFRLEPLPFGSSTGLGDSVRTVVRDRDAWSAIWAQMSGSDGPESPPLVEVDFSAEEVVVVALGVRGSGGYSILIEDVFDRGDHIEVAVRRTEPGRRCVTTSALTAPFDVVRLQRDPRPVQFTERRLVDECD